MIMHLASADDPAQSRAAESSVLWQYQIRNYRLRRRSGIREVRHRSREDERLSTRCVAYFYGGPSC